MNERREPVISGIRPERDEIARHQQRAGGGSPPPPGGRPPASSRPPVVVKSKLAPVALLFAFAGIGLAAYAFWQLTLTQQELESADARLAELEGRMTLSDDESTQSLSVLQASIKTNFSEIDKLWATRNVNKKAIADNNDEIAKIAKANAGLESKLQTKINAAVAEAKLANEVVEAQQGALDALDRKYQQQLAQVQNLSDQVTELEAVKTEYQRRIQNLEQAIEANDAFRRQVTQDLLRLKGQ